MPLAKTALSITFSLNFQIETSEPISSRWHF